VWTVLKVALAALIIFAKAVLTVYLIQVQHALSVLLYAQAVRMAVVPVAMKVFIWT
jgi:hypothetical protein